MSKEFEKKIDNDIRMMKRELIEIKEHVKSMHLDLNKLSGKNHLTESTGHSKFENYKNEKHNDLLQTSPKLTRKKPWRVTSPRDSPPDMLLVKRRATDSNIYIPKSFF